jgi:thiol-disulfide isomerase/thioredoxin
MRTFISVVLALLSVSGAATEASAQETSGVGIALRRDGEDLVVNVLLPDAPAAASKAIHVGDRIIAVAQENAADVRVKGLTTTEVVRLVRGPKGTSVRLTIAPAKKDDTQAFIVTLVRGELKELAGWGDGALLKRGSKAPNIPLAPLGKQRPEHLADYAGKIVVLEFWSIGCGPCQGRMADLQSYPDKYPEWKDRVVLIGACSVNDIEDAVSKHVKAKGWDKIHNVRISDEVMRAYHVNALPTVYVIDQRGEVVDSSHVLDVPTIVNRLLQSK